MRINNLWNALLIFAVALTGCSDDEFEEIGTPWQEGEGICFGARAGFEVESSQSRTDYTGTIENGYELMTWVKDPADEVTILCPQATVTNGGSEFRADYKITTQQDAAGQFDALAPVSSYTLQWGKKEQHDFYAVYPSMNQMRDPGTNRQGLTLEKTQDGVVLSGITPVVQIPSRLERTSTGYYARPIMRDAVMVAKTKVDPNNQQTPSVNLSFRSVMTAVELEFKNTDTQSQERTLLSIMLRSNKHNLAGPYKSVLNPNLPDGEYDKFELNSSVATSHASNQVTIPLSQKDASGVEKGLSLRPNQTIKVIAFILPIENLDDLEVTVTGLRGAKTHKLSSESKQFKAHLKHYVKNVALPSAFKTNNWLSLVNDNVYLSQLSIPATGNSYSYVYDDAALDAKYKKTQTKTIEEQWNLGIRCFEISCYQNKNGKGSLGDSPVQVNKDKITVSQGNTKVEKTVSEAVNEIKGFVEQNQTEFAMIIINNQPPTARDPQKFLSEFNRYFEETQFVKQGKSQNVILFRPGLTVGEARGKLMFIVRATSDGEEETHIGGYNNKEFLIVEGWGSLHDKWKQRGYLDNAGQPVVNIAVERKTDEYAHTVEYLYMLKEAPRDSKKAPLFPSKNSIPKTNSNFVYSTNQNFEVHAQEWPRVVPTSLQPEIIDNQTLAISKVPLKLLENSLWVKWFDSYDEKLNDVKSTFQSAVADKENETTVYFNSLCGYFVVNSSDIPKDVLDSKGKSILPDYRYKWSYPIFLSGQFTDQWSKAYGDIYTFSDKINIDFYKFMWEKWKNRITGPMGVIMMNRVGIEGKDETFLLPNLVISNNFTFPLKKKLSGGNQPTPSQKVDNSYLNGGDVIQ